MVNKTEKQRKEQSYMLDKGYYDRAEANLLRGLGREDQHNIKETLRHVPLNKLIRRGAQELGLKVKEFLARSGTTGIAGAAYLIPEKIYQIMFDSAVESDMTARISRVMIGADDIPGATLKVDIAEDESYKPKKFSSGGSMPTETIKTVQATLDFISWGINFPITNDLIEDSQFDIIEMHLSNAGREMGEYASNEAVTVLKTATDGDGTVNGGLSGDAAQTKFVGGGTNDLTGIHQAILNDAYRPTLCIATPEVWYHDFVGTAHITTSTYSAPWAYEANINGLPAKLLGCDMIWSNLDTITNTKLNTECVTIMFDPQYALVTGRKRWLRIEKYSDPIRDLVGATVTARQDSVTLYNDSIGVITETP